MTMKINTLKHFTADATKSLDRNRTLTIASVLTVSITMFVFGIFMLVSANVNMMLDDLGSSLEVTVFMYDDISEQEQNAIESRLEGIEGVAELRYESKEEALQNVKEELGEENEYLFADFDEENNPFPASYIVRTENPEDVNVVVESIQNMPGIENIRESQELVEAVESIGNTAQTVGITFSVILLVVSLFLIGNTIKLTVFSRQKEISIMKYVGATDAFVRWPFIIEGMIIGLIGGVVATVILFTGYSIFLSSVGVGAIINFMSSTYVLTSIMWKFMLAGLVIGSLGSIISLKKFLKV